MSLPGTGHKLSCTLGLMPPAFGVLLFKTVRGKRAHLLRLIRAPDRYELKLRVVYNEKMWTPKTTEIRRLLHSASKAQDKGGFQKKCGNCL